MVSEGSHEVAPALLTKASQDTLTSQAFLAALTPKSEWSNDVYLAEACKERLLTQTEIPEWHNIDMFMGGIAELKSGYHVERDQVGVHTLLFTLSGGGVLTTAKEVIAIEPNSLTVLPARTSFRFELNPALGEWHMIWLLPKESAKWHLISDVGQQVLRFNQCEMIWSLMCLLFAEIGGRPSFRRFVVSEIQRLLTGIETTRSTSLSRVQTLFNEVESQLHLPWTVEQMAQRCFISEEQLNRLTKQLYGLSPRAKLIQLRMDKAADLLGYKEWSITMIAHRLGYRDPYNFTHRFRKHFGMSPSHYRKMMYIPK
ncbi:helix-turn-helix transcriptional regulator [Vibrio sp. SM6]|uniref:Helix-turn-helix transcriptional regulator n=2 Tax=Vibrio agarilyticus TaxID=2726741 RepID=A0A7X8TRU8_9VIBR|nr:helix-turn-helix transcriptional regulator [Vibrio agarilyticus]